MAKELIGEDESYKFMVKKLKVKFFRRLGYDCEEIVFINPELIPPDRNHKFMDVAFIVDGEYKGNIEFQSTPVYGSKMEDMYKYRVFSQAEDFSNFRTIVFATYNPNQGIRNSEQKWNVNFHPDFYYTKHQKASEIIKIIKMKNKNNIPLTDNEAIDLLIIPDMDHDCDMKELLKISSELLCNARIDDKEFHLDLIDCQKKVVQRFFKRNERKEMDDMLNLKAKDYGFEPNVTGFEEAVNLSFLDGKREGFDDGKREGFDDGKRQTNINNAKKLLLLGVAPEIISEATGLDLKTLKELNDDAK